MADRVVIIGSGPAGYSAGLYLARAQYKPLVLTGPDPGGQLMKTNDVENYPGFSEGIVGPKLMTEMQGQAERFGAIVKYKSVVSVDASKKPFVVKTDSGDYESDSVVVATGSSSRMLGAGEEKYIGKGVSMCAVCDAAFYKEKNVYVVGGGDAAIEDALALSKFASSVTMIVRRGEFRASKAMQKRVGDNSEKIKVMWKSKVVDVVGEDELSGIVVDRDGKKEELSADGLFLAIGHVPASGFLDGSGVKVDDKGYVVTGMTGLVSEVGDMWRSGYPTMTSVDGVFACGDVVDYRYQQAVTAAGMGVSCALDVEKWLDE